MTIYFVDCVQFFRADTFTNINFSEIFAKFDSFDDF